MQKGQWGASHPQTLLDLLFLAPSSLPPNSLKSINEDRKSTTMLDQETIQWKGTAIPIVKPHPN